MEFHELALINLYIMRFILTIIWLIIVKETTQLGILYPRDSESREVRSLDGLWNFVVSPTSDLGQKQSWYKNSLTKLKNVDLHLMPVPSSYNDITQNSTIRDHVGVVWYDRTFFVPKTWKNKRVCLRFHSVSYLAQVWVNGQLVMKHEIGHLPFEKEISSLLTYGGNNRISVSCDNTLTPTTVPQGTVRTVDTDEGKKLIQSYAFDFFNYAGIHRPVTLYTTPKSYIDDISIKTDIEGEYGLVHYNITYYNVEPIACSVLLLNADNVVMTKQASLFGTGVLKVYNPKLWWPYLMDPNPGYLYTLQVELTSTKGELVDIYRLPVGIRTISWTNTEMFINNRPIYFTGFGRHEDSDIRGKGLDMPLIIRDHNLLKWMGANSYRTSHYPYAEEIMDLADKMGIMIIDECPSVNTNQFSLTLLGKHKNSLTELIQRDKNRPSVIMWSIANEPETNSDLAGLYFAEVVKHVKTIDSERPVTVAISHQVDRDQVGQHLDIVSFNRYNSWYSNSGRLDMIIKNVIQEATAWRKKYNKPIIMSEYGADTAAGLHIYPQFVWSEEFQVSMLSKHFKAFDILRGKKWFIGEYIWNFADFQTAQAYTRVGGNKKGVFTRNRQPKAGAHHLRKRYFLLANEIYNASLPKDLYEYLSPFPHRIHNEL